MQLEKLRRIQLKKYNGVTMGLLDKKEEKIEKKLIVKSTTKYEDFKKAVKYLCVFILSIIIIYGLYLAFGVFIFGSLFITFLISSGLLFKIVEVPTEYFIEARIEGKKDKDDKEKKDTVKTTNFVLNEFAIPLELLKDFTIQGDTTTKWKSKSGKIRSIVEKIDFNNKIITYPWYSRISDFDYMVDRDTFFLCKGMFQEQNKNLLINEHTRELHYQVELTRMYRSLNTDQDKDEIFKEYEDKLTAKIKGIWDNAKN